jgi:hypothetical protein
MDPENARSSQILEKLIAKGGSEIYGFILFAIYFS